MSDISKIKVEDTIYDVKDNVARAANNELANSLSEEINTRQTQDTTLLNKINEEEQHRTNADLDLQEQIDAITSASDVVDVVGTKADLDEYDTSKLKDNDIIKVLQDETHNDAISYYRWNINTSIFTFIGSQGPYFTKSETEQRINEHHDNSKQDLLKSGENIKTLNGQGLLGEGNLEIKGTHILGKASDFSSTNRINLNNLDVGTYILAGRVDGNNDNLYFEATYNGTKLTYDAKKVDCMPGSFYTLSIVKKVSDDLLNREVFAHLSYQKADSSTSGTILGTHSTISFRDGALSLSTGSIITIQYIPSSGNQTVNGVKTFTSLPESSAEPTKDNQLVNKKYVDDNIADHNEDTTSHNDIRTSVSLVEGDVSDIKEVIPTQASSNNKLADRNFVNSSVATATATFKGTWNSIDDFPTTGVDENDYVYYRHTDTVGNTIFDRYKYTNGEWEYEYSLNNSSFTADQWAAINSGISDVLVTLIQTNRDNIATILADYIKSTDYATATKGGVIKTTINNAFSVDNNGIPYSNNYSYQTYINLGNYAFLGKGTFENVLTGKGLVKATEISSTSTDDNVATPKAVYEYIQSLDGSEVAY